jgi:hypothetical protein
VRRRGGVGDGLAVEAGPFRRRPRLAWLLALAGLLGLSGLVGPVAGPSGAAAPAAAAGCPIFPSDDVWHADVSRLPVNAHSAAWLSSMGGASKHLHPDFGPSDGAVPYGIPYDVVDASTPRVAVTFDYGDESDPGPYPFTASTTIESGDRHALMLDRQACRLYELYDADWNGGHPTAGSGAVYDLRSNALRPAGWTSADAAGLPIFPGLLRLEKVRSGVVDHAVRITAQTTDRSFLWPARHQAGSAANPNLPPMGAWFRLRGDFDISHFSHDTQVILTAFKVHGLVVADNGSNWYFGGSADVGWPEGVLDELKSIPAGAFEAVDASSLMVSPDSGQVRSSPPVLPASTPSGAVLPKTKVIPAAGAASGSSASAVAPTTTVATTTAPSTTVATTAVPSTPLEPATRDAASAVEAPDHGGARFPAAVVGSLAVAGLGAGWLGLRRRRAAHRLSPDPR